MSMLTIRIRPPRRHDAWEVFTYWVNVCGEVQYTVVTGRTLAETVETWRALVRWRIS